MASCALLLLLYSVLSVAEGSKAGISSSKRWTGRGGKLTSLSIQSRCTGSTVELATSSGPVLARRDLAVRLGATGASAVKGAVHPEDAAVLQKAAAQWKKNPDTMDEHKLLSTWDGARPCSQWHGVTCDSATHRVTGIKLPGLYDYDGHTVFWLAGAFPAVLGSLPELRSLILAHNGFSQATFPKEWTLLKKLSHLDLSDNDLSSGGLVPPPVPQELCSLTGLTYLNLAATGYGHPLPKQFNGLSRLAWLDLSSIVGVKLSDIQILGNLTSLKTLHLQSLDFDLRDFSPLSQLRALQSLDLSTNNLESAPTFVKGLKRLEDLDLHANNFETVPLPSSLGSLQYLTSLDLSFNMMRGSLPEHLWGLPRLAKLVLGSNALTGKVPGKLLDSPTLTHLDLSNNGLSLSGIAFGPHASSKLKVLDLSKNKLGGSIPSGLSGLTSLKSLSLSYNQLTGTVPQFLWTIPSLTWLDLSKGSLTGLAFGSEQIRAVKLRSLDLSSNKLQGPVPQNWSTLTSLTALLLSHNKLTGSIPDWLGALKGLVELSLTSNQLTGSLPGSLFRPGRSLSLAANRFSGNLPTSALSVMANRLIAAGKGDTVSGAVDVSDNYLTGPCYSTLVASLKCPVAGPMQLMPAIMLGDICPSQLSEELHGLSKNCLQGCNKIPYGYPPQQRSVAQCAWFCGADKPSGPCNGHGFCTLPGPQKTPTCNCSKGFVAPASKPGTCAPLSN